MAGLATERFSSRWVFVVSTVGAAVGLGNIWRFPFVAGSNGGGSFLVAYLIAMVAVAMPMAAIELAAGRGSRAGIVGTFAAARPWARPLGAAVALAAVVIVGYYLVVTGWTLGYAVEATLQRDLQPFSEFTAGYASLWWFIVVLVVSLGVVARGIQGGIELVSKLLTPLLLVILATLAVYVASLDHFPDAVEFYLVPDAEALRDPLTWVAAVGQVFFSVGVGMGVLITYGAYVSEREHIAGSAVGLVLADAAIAFVAGLVVFPLAFAVGESPQAGPELAFNSLPEAFRELGAAGSLIAVAFYVSLFAAALTSAVALIEVAVVALRELAGVPRLKAVFLLAVPIALVGTLSALSYADPALTLAGGPILDRLDDGVGEFALPLGVLATALIVGWFLPGLLRSGIPGLPGRGAVIAARFAVPLAILVTLAAHVI